MRGKLVKLASSQLLEAMLTTAEGCPLIVLSSKRYPVSRPIYAGFGSMIHRDPAGLRSVLSVLKFQPSKKLSIHQFSTSS
jgi:hypothetical protein